MKLNRMLIKGSFILLVAFGISSAINFIFQLTMARMLTIVEYGILATLSSIIYIFLIFTESIQTIMTKYSANEREIGRLKGLLKKSSLKSISFAWMFFIFYLVLSIPLSFLLKINYLLLSFNGLVIFSAFSLPIPRGIMQGRKMFKPLGVNMVIESVAKLALGVLFVFIGWSVLGAVAGILLGGVLAFAISFMPLKDIISSKKAEAKTVGIYGYAKPAFLVTAFIIIFYSIDIVIAKIFFIPEVAGTYAVASILAKSVFWGTLPISKAMFPMTAENSKKKSENVFSSSLLMVIAVIATALIIFISVPDFIITLFSGKILEEASSILVYLGIGTGLISLANLVILYKLSLGKTRGHQSLLIFVLLEIALLSYFSNNLFQFSIAFITASAALLWGSIILMND